MGQGPLVKAPFGACRRLGADNGPSCSNPKVRVADDDPQCAVARVLLRVVLGTGSSLSCWTCSWVSLAACYTPARRPHRGLRLRI